MGPWKFLGCTAALLAVLAVRPCYGALYNVVDLGYLPNSNSGTTGSMGL